jgi:hypothetical protein
LKKPSPSKLGKKNSSSRRTPSKAKSPVNIQVGVQIDDFRVKNPVKIEFPPTTDLLAER